MKFKMLNNIPVSKMVLRNSQFLLLPGKVILILKHPFAGF